MKLTASLLLGVSFAAGLAVHAEVKPPEGFTALFNGTDLNGWWGLGTDHYDKYMNLSPEDFAKRQEASRADIRQHWAVKDGELVNDGKGLYLTTDKFYGDFEFMVEYKTLPKGDSGIYLRGCPQVQIWDPTNKAEWGNGADKGSGGLWNNTKEGRFPMVRADNPPGQWNAMRILMEGDKVSIWLNDQLLVDAANLENYWAREKPIQPAEQIELQAHGNEVRFRNLRIR